MRPFIVLGSFVAFLVLFGLTAGLQPSTANVANLRKQLLYPYLKEHLESQIRNQQPQIKINLNFAVPFFGSRFNYTIVSLHGALKFSKEDSLQDYPISFPNVDWPDQIDPSIIGPFYAVAAIRRGDNVAAHADKSPGVYFKTYRNIASSQNQDDVDLHEAIRQDIQEGIMGATEFQPKHVIIVTWRNITFGGGINPDKTNTYQVMLATDDHRTYALFNYQNISWTSSTVAGGDTKEGVGGITAFVGFNAGNGTRAFEYNPYSQTSRILELLTKGQTNNHPARHIFRIDEFVQQGSCKSGFSSDWSDLILSTSSAPMLGGKVVNISGPCFEVGKKLIIRFHDQNVICAVRNQRVATCITPPVHIVGIVDVATIREPGVRPFATRMYIENPMLSPELVWVEDNQVFNKLDVANFELHWDNNSLHWGTGRTAHVNLYGYKETANGPQIEHIRLLKDVPNNGSTRINLADYSNANDGIKRNYTIGLIQVNTSYVNKNVSAIWSRPIPLGWYFSNQWTKQLGPNWSQTKCNDWVKRETILPHFDADSLPACPCTIDEAREDKGRFMPDINCDEMGVTNCYGNGRIRHCVISAHANPKSSGQHCCYDFEGYLLTPADTNTVYGFSMRSHPFGQYPYDDNGTVPGLSYWYHDLAGYYACCAWSNGSDTCSKFMSLRPSNDCTGYKRNNVSQVYGDPHFITYDNLNYTFNGKGEFVLSNVANKSHNQLDVQARFEQYRDEQKLVKQPGTLLTAVAAKSNTSDTIEIQQRPSSSGWRHKLNVLVKGKPVYFDKPSKQIQTFKGVTVYTPRNILNQSNVVVAFESGAGLEVISQYGLIAVRVYLPHSYMKRTRGLLGNWSNNARDDLVTPDGHVVALPVNDLQEVHTQFGLKWMLENTENSTILSLFHYENGRTTRSYNDKSFRPVFEMYPPLPITSHINERDIELACWSRHGQVSPECRYDYIVTENRNVARASQYFINDFDRLLTSVPRVRLCPAITPSPHMRLSTNRRTVHVQVKFECEKGFVLQGADQRSCLPSFKWMPALDEQVTRCVKQ